jgi:glycyl-tRNA synthetase beta subunit
MSVSVTLSGYQEILKTLHATEEQIQKALFRSVNKLIRWLKSEAARQISQETQVQVKFIKQRLKTFLASKDKKSAILNAVLYGIRAIILGAKQNRTGVRAGKKTFSGSFISKMPGSRAGVFRRKGQTRLPIQEQKVALEPFASQALLYLLTKLNDKFLKYFKHELKFILGSFYVARAL